LQRSPHDDGYGSLVVCVPPCLLRDIFPAITILESKIEFVVVQERAVPGEMSATPEVAKKKKKKEVKLFLNHSFQIGFNYTSIRAWGNTHDL